MEQHNDQVLDKDQGLKAQGQRQDQELEFVLKGDKQ